MAITKCAALWFERGAYKALANTYLGMKRLARSPIGKSIFYNTPKRVALSALKGANRLGSVVAAHPRVALPVGALAMYKALDDLGHTKIYTYHIDPSYDMTEQRFRGIYPKTEAAAQVMQNTPKFPIL